MAEKFNPFHKWLGLKPNVKNPHHFQLLGVSTKLTDSAEVKKAVDAGVKRHLSVLAKVPAGKADTLVAQLKKRIATARATLLDDRARVAYLEQLKNQVRAQQTGAKPSTPIQPTSPVDLVPPATSSPIVAPIPNAPQLSSPDPPSVLPTVSATPTPSQLPSAIPMAVPLSQNAVAHSTPAMGQPVEAVNQGLAFDEEGMPTKVKINKNSVRRRRGSKYAGPLVAGFLILTTVVGGYLIYSNLDSILAMGGIDPESPAAPGTINDETKKSDPSAPPVPGNNSKEPDKLKPLPKIDLDGIPEVDVDAVMSHEATLKATGRTKARKKKPVDAPGKTNGGEAKSNSPPMEEMTGDPDSKPVKPSKNLMLDEANLAKFRRHIQRARRSLFRRDKGVTLNEIEIAEDILNEAGSDLAFDFVPEHEPIVKLVAATKEVTELIDGFWIQVIASCQTIPQGQEIEVGQQRIAFIAANKGDFTVRKSGTNVTFKYHFCPPGLAVALASQGTVEDVPTWEKQQAAFYAVNQVLGEDYHEQVDQHMTIAEEAGHDGELIHHYADFDFDTLGLPENKIEVPSKKKLEELTAEFREESGYEKIRMLTPEMAGARANVLFQVDSPNFEQHYALLDEARQLSIRAGDAFMVEDTVIEMGIYADIDQPNLTCESFTDLAKSKKLDESQCRILMESAIAFLRSKEAKSATPRSRKSLFSRLVQIGKDNDMRDSTARLVQLERESKLD